MKDICLVAVGIISLILLIWYDIVRLKKEEYDSGIFGTRKSSENKLLVVIVSVAYNTLLFFMEDAILKLTYMLIMLILAIMYITISNLMIYRKKRSKKYIYEILRLNGVLIICGALLIYVFWPKYILQISGTDISQSSSVNLEMVKEISKKSFSSKSSNSKRIDELINYLKNIKCISNNSYTYYDEKVSYTIKINGDDNEINGNDNEILMLITNGDNHLVIKNKKGDYKQYQIINGKLDMEFLEKVFNSLGKKIPDEEYLEKEN